MQKKFTLTETGTTDTILVSPSDIITFGAQGDASDYTLTAEVKLTDNGNWFTAQAITDDEIYSTVSGVRAFRFNLTALGAASSIDVEVTSADM